MILRNSSNGADLKLPSEHNFGLLFSVVFASAGAYVHHKSSPPFLAAAFFVVAAIFLTIDLLMGLLIPTEGELLVDGPTSYPPCGAASLLWNWNTDGWWRKIRTNHAYPVETQNDGSAPWQGVALRLFIRCLCKENKK
jgi:hypothetical protein